MEQSARRCHVRILSDDVQTPLKNSFVTILSMILLVCYSDFTLVLATVVALLLRPLSVMMMMMMMVVQTDVMLVDVRIK